MFALVQAGPFFDFKRNSAIHRLSPDLGTEADLNGLVREAKESGLGVFLQLNIFTTLTSGRWFAQCRKNIADCRTFVVRQEDNEWRKADGGSPW